MKANPERMHQAIEMMAWTHAVSLAGDLFGKKAAAAVWAQSPLPQFVGAGRASEAKRGAEPGLECLEILARWIPPGHPGDVGSLVVAAVNGDEDAVHQLEDIGVLLNPPGNFGFAAICTTMGAARSAWATTPYAVSWASVLKALPGALEHVKKIRVRAGTGGRTHAVFVPTTLFHAAEFPSDSEPLLSDHDGDAADIEAGRWLAKAFAGRLGLG